MLIIIKNALIKWNHNAEFLCCITWYCAPNAFLCATVSAALWGYQQHQPESLEDVFILKMKTLNHSWCCCHKLVCSSNSHLLVTSSRRYPRVKNLFLSCASCQILCQSRLQLMQTRHNLCHALLAAALSVPLWITRTCAGVESVELTRVGFFLESGLQQQTLSSWYPW